MSDQTPPTSDPLPTSVDLRCDRFEVAWRDGHHPRIEEYLAEVPECHHQRLVRELLALELHFRIRGGDRPATADYHGRFPAYSDAIVAAFACADSANGWDTGPFVRPAGQIEVPFNIGRYHILELLGAGTFGAVYRGRDDELNRDIAIKVPHRERFAS